MRVKLLEGASAPRRATDGSAGYDFFAYESATIYPNESAAIRTGVCVEIPKGWVGLMLPRSSHSLHSRLTCNVIDSDYRGEVRVIICNGGDGKVNIIKGDRIAQLVIVQHLAEPIEVVAGLTETVRGSHGFGSTGR
jgi:dUTP pyrophosphatase